MYFGNCQGRSCIKLYGLFRTAAGIWQLRKKLKQEWPHELYNEVIKQNFYSNDVPFLSESLTQNMNCRQAPYAPFKEIRHKRRQ